MDRTKQLGNVAFGGAWSEVIAGKERLIAAMERVERAPAETADEDLRLDQALQEDVRLLLQAHPRGRLLEQGWQKALSQQNPGIRAQMLEKTIRTIRDGLGSRLVL